MKYGYISVDEHTDLDIRNAFEIALKDAKIEIDALIDDNAPNRIHWKKRSLKRLIDIQLNPGDTLICYEASNLARSTLQVLEVINELTAKQINIRFLKHDDQFEPTDDVDTEYFLNMMQNIENDFVARRTTDALARRRAQGLPLGRPKGRRNKSRKLDKVKGEIKKYLALNISKASIAKLVGCHAQTLYNYIDDKGLDAEVAKEQAEGQTIEGLDAALQTAMQQTPSKPLEKESE